MPTMRKWNEGKWNDGGVWNGTSLNPPILRRAMKIIKMPVSGLNPDDLNTAATNLLTKLAENVADFPAPPVTDLTTHQGNLETQLGELATLEGQVTAKRLQIDSTCTVVRADMNNLGEWGEGVTQDPIKLAKVFVLRSAPTPSGPTPRAVNLKLSIGDAAGQVDGDWDSLYRQGVKSYEVQTVINPLNNDPNSGSWAQQPTVTKSKCTLAGFASGARIWVRVRAIGPNGLGEWSDPATIIVP